MLPRQVLDSFTPVQIAALKRLGLSIRKGKIRPGSEKNAVHTFLITDSHTADKILKSARLEEIRFTILQNLLRYHPEAGQKLGGMPGKRAAKPRATKPTDRPLGARKLYALSHTSFTFKPRHTGLELLAVSKEHTRFHCTLCNRDLTRSLFINRRPACCWLQ